MLYTACMEVAEAMEFSLPLGPKTSLEISQVVDEYDRNREVFEAICVTQHKKNS